MAKHRFRYNCHQLATRPEELVAMFHAANDIIGIDKARLNETTIAQNILSLQRISTSMLRKPTSMLLRLSLTFFKNYLSNRK